MALKENKYFSYTPSFIKNHEECFKNIMQEIEFEQKIVKVFGKEYLEPRLTSVHGDNNVLDKTYTYSKSIRKLKPMTTTIVSLQKQIEEYTGIHFNFVLLNLYRNGHDKVGWHSDNEKEMDTNYIASISLGASRKFRFRANGVKIWEENLLPGSLVWMKSGCQENLQHEVPKQLTITEPRINLTFRIFL
jgi:alkylated DNA repair dioxygenase AlkB